MDRDARNFSADVQDWCQRLRDENHELGAQVRGLAEREKDVMRRIPDAARRGYLDCVRLLGAAVAQGRRQRARLLETQAHVGAAVIAFQRHAVTMRAAAVLEKDAEALKAVNGLFNLDAMSARLLDLRRQVKEMGIVLGASEQRELQGVADAVSDGDVEVVLREALAVAAVERRASFVPADVAPESVGDGEGEDDEMETIRRRLRELSD